MTHKKAAKKLKLVGLILLVLLAVVTLGFLTTNLKPTSKSITPLPPTETWQTYQNSYFKLSYPPNWILKEGYSEDVGCENCLQFYDPASAYTVPDKYTRAQVTEFANNLNVSYQTPQTGYSYQKFSQNPKDIFFDPKFSTFNYLKSFKNGDNFDLVEVKPNLGNYFGQYVEQAKMFYFANPKIYLLFRFSWKQKPIDPTTINKIIQSVKLF